MDKNIIITDQDIKDAVDNLNIAVNEPGIVGFSKFLFSESGIILRLETEVDYVPTSVEDEGKVANVRAEFNAEQAQLKANYPNLTDEEFEAQVKADDRAARIAEYVSFGVTQEEAIDMVDREIAQEDAELEKAKAKEGFDLNEYKFRKWIEKNNKDITKQIFIIRGGEKLHIDYTFDQAIVGVAGGATLGNLPEFGMEEAVTFDGVKADFADYIASDKFKAGLAFISRITDVNLTVALG